MGQASTWAAIGLAAVVAVGAAPVREAGSEPMEKGMRIRIVIDSAALTATLEDTVASRDLAALLPLDVTFTDHNRTEKIADLPTRLSTDGMPEGVDPDIGDIAYFAPWGNLAVFYRDFGFARGLVRLGRIEAGLEHLATADSAFGARIERVEEPE